MKSKNHGLWAFSPEKEVDFQEQSQLSAFREPGERLAVAAK